MPSTSQSYQGRLPLPGSIFLSDVCRLDLVLDWFLCVDASQSDALELNSGAYHRVPLEGYDNMTIGNRDHKRAIGSLSSNLCI